MTSYTQKESYMHLYAKEVLKEWISTQKYTQISHRHGEDTIYLEYPIATYNELNSISIQWYELWNHVKWDEYNKLIEKPERYENSISYMPTFDDCVAHDIFPVAVADIAISYKGVIHTIIEICHKNPVSDEKIKKLHTMIESCGYEITVWEIDAGWIMNHTKPPKKLRMKQIFPDYDEDFTYSRRKRENDSYLLTYAKIVFNDWVKNHGFMVPSDCHCNQDHGVIMKYPIVVGDHGIGQWLLEYPREIPSCDECIQHGCDVIAVADAALIHNEYDYITDIYFITDDLRQETLECITEHSDANLDIWQIYPSEIMKQTKPSTSIQMFKRYGYDSTLRKYRWFV